MLENMYYRLACLQNEIEKQEKEYLWAVTWGLNTKAIVYKLLGLRTEVEILKSLIEKLKKQKNAR